MLVFILVHRLDHWFMYDVKENLDGTWIIIYPLWCGLSVFCKRLMIENFMCIIAWKESFCTVIYISELPIYKLPTDVTQITFPKFRYLRRRSWDCTIRNGPLISNAPPPQLSAPAFCVYFCYLPLGWWSNLIGYITLRRHSTSWSAVTAALVDAFVLDSKIEPGITLLFGSVKSTRSCSLTAEIPLWLPMSVPPSFQTTSVIPAPKYTLFL